MAKATTKKSKAAPIEDEGPSGLNPQETAEALRALAADPRMDAPLRKLQALAAAGNAAAGNAATGQTPGGQTPGGQTPGGQPEQPVPNQSEQPVASLPKQAENRFGTIPQSLLIEGGTEAERLHAALYWAALLNCEAPVHSAVNAQPGLKCSPCLKCSACLRMIGLLHRDCFFFDGRTESIKIDSVRELRSVLGEPPREANYRVVIFCEAQSMGDVAANSLLKSLEDPRPGTSFLLLAPQRERLLPTLVSRSWILTLPWPRSDQLLEGPQFSESVEWAQAMLHLARTGQGWMDRTSRKGSLDKKLALHILANCRQALAQALSNPEGATSTPLSLAFSALPPARQRMIDEALAEAQESLEYNVGPALVMDWLATRFYFILGPALRQPARGAA